MPSVVHPPSSDFPHFPLVRYPSHREGRNTAAMTGLAVLIVFDDFFWEGAARKCGLGGQKSRFHRHRTRPLGSGRLWTGSPGSKGISRTGCALGDARVGRLEQLPEIVEHEVGVLQLVDLVGPAHHLGGVE